MVVTIIIQEAIIHEVIIIVEVLVQVVIIIVVDTAMIKGIQADRKEMILVEIKIIILIKMKKHERVVI